MPAPIEIRHVWDNLEISIYGGGMGFSMSRRDWRVTFIYANGNVKFEVRCTGFDLDEVVNDAWAQMSGLIRNQFGTDAFLASPVIDHAKALEDKVPF